MVHRYSGRAQGTALRPGGAELSEVSGDDSVIQGLYLSLHLYICQRSTRVVSFDYFSYDFMPFKKFRLKEAVELFIRVSRVFPCPRALAVEFCRKDRKLGALQSSHRNLNVRPGLELWGLL